MANILLADDDGATRDLVSRALAQEGHKVHAANDGAEALEYFEKHHATIDVIVSDVDMPGLDGISLVGNALAKKPALAIVLMSGFSDQLGKASKLNARRLVSISKPFTLEQIKQTVRGVLA